MIGRDGSLVIVLAADTESIAAACLSNTGHPDILRAWQAFDDIIGIQPIPLIVGMRSIAGIPLVMVRCSVCFLSFQMIVPAFTRLLT